MRKILFKAKCVDGGNWVYGDLIHHPYGTAIGVVEDGGLHELYVDENTICQYTGLTDKNGRRIWECDILQRTVSIYKGGKLEPCGERIMTGCVIWDDSSFTYPGHWALKAEDEFGNPTIYCFSNDFRDVGNIFDNPELLEGGAE